MGFRKRIFAAVSVAGFAGAAVLGTGIVRGDLPMNVALSGQTFTATLGGLTGTDVTIFPNHVNTARGERASMAIRLGTATITDLCLAITAHDIPVLGDTTMFIRSAGASTTAKNLVIEAVSVGGEINIGSITIGGSAPVTEGEAARLTAAIRAEGSALAGARIEAVSLRADSLRLKNFTATTARGDKKC